MVSNHGHCTLSISSDSNVAKFPKQKFFRLFDFTELDREGMDILPATISATNSSSTELLIKSSVLLIRG